MLRRTILAVPALALAQTSDTAEVRKAFDSFADALQRNDVPGVARLLSDDLIYTHSNGLVETKDQYLAKLKTGEQRYAGLEWTGLKIRRYGNTAVINTQGRFTGATKGVPFDNTLFLIHVWVKEGAGWKLVAHQTTRKT